MSSNSGAGDLPGHPDRALGALIGPFIGDALCLGSHWYYDLGERDSQHYPGGIKGFDAPLPDHYHSRRKPGQPTHYGDAVMVALRSAVDCGGFDADDFGRRFVNTFWAADYDGYIDKATRGMLEQFEDFTASHGGGRFDFQHGA